MHDGRQGTGLRLVHAIERPCRDDRSACVLSAAERVAHETVTGVDVTVAASMDTLSPAELLVRKLGGGRWWFWETAGTAASPAG